jgi:coronatine-insensitive protein 1
MGTNEMQILFPYAAALKKLDLQFTFLSTEEHCQIVQRCPNLETLEVFWNILEDAFIFPVL